MEKGFGQTVEEREYYSLSKRVYAVFAPFYDAVTFPLKRLRREVASMAGAGPGSKVLDIATGTGAQALAFAETSAEVVGVDLSEAMLRVAQRKNRLPNVTFRQADATELPFEDASFDVSCISFALHEMPSSIRERAVLEMRRVTKPGGTIVIVDYALPENALARTLVYHVVKLYERDHYAGFVRSDLRALLEGMGISVQQERSALLGAAKIVTGFTPAGARSERTSDRAPEHERRS
jgi:demethylmenaquinone methyltransferase/2-methoxy-6-polyprenyl-1,4-benzoquinol methylase